MDRFPSQCWPAADRCQHCGSVWGGPRDSAEGRPFQKVLCCENMCSQCLCTHARVRTHIHTHNCKENATIATQEKLALWITKDIIKTLPVGERLVTSQRLERKKPLKYINNLMNSNILYVWRITGQSEFLFHLQSEGVCMNEPHICALCNFKALGNSLKA